MQPRSITASDIFRSLVSKKRSTRANAFIEHLKNRGCKGITSNILLITGNVGDVDQKKVAELGCTLLQKPLSYAELDEWLLDISAGTQK